MTQTHNARREAKKTDRLLTRAAWYSANNSLHNDPGVRFRIAARSTNGSMPYTDGLGDAFGSPDSRLDARLNARLPAPLRGR